MWVHLDVILWYALLSLQWALESSGQHWETSRTKMGSHAFETHQKQSPVFDESGARNVTAVVGQSAYLPCQVKHLGDKTVSWIRQRDLHILTSGLHVYTGDSRFEVIHPTRSDAWTLRLMSVQKRDQGVYECQVNTDPKMMRSVALLVTDGDMLDSPYRTQSYPPDKERGEEEAKILGPLQQEAKIGGTVSFKCVVHHQQQLPPQRVTWFHGATPVTLTAPRNVGGVSLDTDRSDTMTTSTLVLSHVTNGDAGTYTCSPDDAKPARVQLVIFEGERSQAVHDKGVNRSSNAQTQCLLFLIMLSYFIF